MAPSVRALRNGYYVKRMSITWKLILAIHNFIAEEYVAYKNELDDKCAYDLMVGTCVDSICEAFSGGKVNAPDRHTFTPMFVLLLSNPL